MRTRLCMYGCVHPSHSPALPSTHKKGGLLPACRETTTRSSPSAAHSARMVNPPRCTPPVAAQPHGRHRIYKQETLSSALAHNTNTSDNTTGVGKYEQGHTLSALPKTWLATSAESRRAAPPHTQQLTDPRHTQITDTPPMHGSTYCCSHAQHSRPTSTGCCHLRQMQQTDGSHVALHAAASVHAAPESPTWAAVDNLLAQSTQLMWLTHPSGV
jgi:hypothetical protein